MMQDSIKAVTDKKNCGLSPRNSFKGKVYNIVNASQFTAMQ
jgi:hypothetical protein